MSKSSISEKTRTTTNAHLNRVQSGIVSLNPHEQVSLHLLAVLRPIQPPEESNVHLKRVQGRLKRNDSA